MLPPAIFIGAAPGRSQCHHADDRRQAPDDQPAADPGVAVFWAWVWGTTGALLAVPLLIIMKTIFSAAGTPDIAGFLFEDGTLTHVGDEEEEKDD